MTHLTSKYPQIKPAPAANTSGYPQKDIKTTGIKIRGTGATAITGAVLIFMGKPIDQLLLLASGVAGGLGMILKD